MPRGGLTMKHRLLGSKGKLRRYIYTAQRQLRGAH
jgi:hypothetical protein